jgi:hypothetical protein
MDDRSVTAARWSVVRACESSRHQRQLLAQAYQQVFPQARQSLPSQLNLAVRSCGSAAAAAAQPSAAARVAAGA